MAITLHNYKKYLSEYINGNLDQSLSNELLDFLSVNPGLDIDLIETDKISNIIPISFPYKDRLKRNFSDIPEINEANFNEFCVAELENLLDDYNHQRLLDYLFLHQEKKKDYALFRQIKIKPDLRITFHDKSVLKKKTIRFPLVHNMYFKIAIAAAVILLFILFNPFNFINKKYTHHYITKEEPILNNHSESIIKNNTPAFYADTLNTVGYKKTAFNNRSPDFNKPIQNKNSLEIPPLITPIYPHALNTQANTNNFLSQNFKTAPLISANDSINIYAHNKPLADLQLIKKIDIRKTPETLVKAFNYLTESNVGLYSSFDSNGKLTGLGIKTEYFSFETGKKN